MVALYMLVSAFFLWDRFFFSSKLIGVTVLYAWCKELWLWVLLLTLHNPSLMKCVVFVYSCGKESELKRMHCYVVSDCHVALRVFPFMMHTACMCACVS